MALEDSLKQLVTNEDGSVQIESIEVGGVKVTKTITDRMGKVWALPSDDDNIDLREFRNEFDIPNPDPNFYYQYVRGDRLNEFLNAGYGVVEREEVGVPVRLDTSAYPLINGLSSAHQVGGDYLVKIPKVIEQRRRKIQKMRADEATASIKVPRQLGKPFGGEHGVEIATREKEVIVGPPVVTSAKEFKTFEEEA